MDSSLSKRSFLASFSLDGVRVAGWSLIDQLEPMCHAGDLGRVVARWSITWSFLALDLARIVENHETGLLSLSRGLGDNL
jgi:hypothetical protein